MQNLREQPNLGRTPSPAGQQLLYYKWILFHCYFKSFTGKKKEKRKERKEKKLEERNCYAKPVKSTTHISLLHSAVSSLSLISFSYSNPLLSLCLLLFFIPRALFYPDQYYWYGSRYLGVQTPQFSTWLQRTFVKSNFSPMPQLQSSVK